MHLKNRTPVKSAPTPRLFEHRRQEEKQEQRGLNAAVRFFVDHVVSVAVASVARKQAHTARLAITGASGTVMHILISTLGQGDELCFVAYSNDMCLFVGSSPSLYVVEQTPRAIEHSIYLFLSEKLSTERMVSAQIFRESNSMFVLPVLEGTSDHQGGQAQLKPRAAVVNA